MAKDRKQWLVPHAAAELFPLMEGAEYEALKQDIKERGQHVPIVLHEGRILDGRNRYHALCDLEIEPITEQYDGSDPIAYVVSTNLRRRHLSVSQQGMIGAEALDLYEASAKERQRAAGGDKVSGHAKEALPANLPEAVKGEAREHAAKLVGVSPRTISDAKAIKESDPVLAQEVRDGKITVHAAKKKIEEKKQPVKPKPSKATDEVPAWKSKSFSRDRIEKIEAAAVLLNEHLAKPSLQVSLHAVRKSAREVLTLLTELLS